MTIERKNLLLKSKRAQSDIIATLLIILLVIIAGGVLLRFLVPYVQSWLSKGDCFQFNNKVNIINDPTYTCYDRSTNSLYLKVGFGDFDDNSKNKVTGLIFLIDDINSRVSYELYPPNSNPPGISLLNGDIGSLPLKNQERTYKIMNISIKPNSTIIYPLIDKKRKCGEVTDSIDFIPPCTNMFMSINTTLFTSGGNIPVGFNNQISVIGIPDTTANLAIIVEDINDSLPNSEHLVVPNIPILPGVKIFNIDISAIHPIINPPLVSGRKVTHYYTFTVYAINNTISPISNTKADVLPEINKTNKLGQATLYGKITSS